MTNKNICADPKCGHEERTHNELYSKELKDCFANNSKKGERYKQCPCKKFKPQEELVLIKDIDDLVEKFKVKCCGKPLVTSRQGKDDGINCGDFKHYIECVYYGERDKKECTCFEGEIKLCESCKPKNHSRQTKGRAYYERKGFKNHSPSEEVSKETPVKFQSSGGDLSSKRVGSHGNQFYQTGLYEGKDIKDFIQKLKGEIKNDVEQDDSWEGFEWSINKLAGKQLSGAELGAELT